MNVFADECARLHYHQGTVSFCLESDKSSYAGVTVHLPFAAFHDMQKLFAAELEEMTAAHQSWLAFQAPNEAPEKVVQEKQLHTAPLGEKIASI
ncbi:MAG: hypothetical protein AAFW60_07665 [Pseudomonadota bacterium]